MFRAAGFILLISIAAAVLSISIGAGGPLSGDPGDVPDGPDGADEQAARVANLTYKPLEKPGSYPFISLVGGEWLRVSAEHGDGGIGFDGENGFIRAVPKTGFVQVDTAGGSSKMVRVNYPGGLVTVCLANGDPYTIEFKNKDKAGAADSWFFRRGGYFTGHIAGVAIVISDENSNGVYNDYGDDGIVIGGTGYVYPLLHSMNIGSKLYSLDVSEDGKTITFVEAAPDSGDKKSWYETGPDGKGVIVPGLYHSLTSEGGLTYSIQIPGDYSPEKGAILVMEFHGGHGMDNVSFFDSGNVLPGAEDNVLVCPKAPGGMYEGSEAAVLDLVAELERKGLKFTRKLTFGKPFAFIAVQYHDVFDGASVFSCYYTGITHKDAAARELPVAVYCSELYAAYVTSKAAHEYPRPKISGRWTLS